jgi:catechol 2,3-dioxygenase-like lactoylglutathione lyase family enzyme
VPEGSARNASAVVGVNHLAHTTGDIDRLADFYVDVFGAEVLARAEGVPRKCVIRLTRATNLHVFEVGPDQARTPGDPPFDRASISHFALDARPRGVRRGPRTTGRGRSLRRRRLRAGGAVHALRDRPGRTIRRVDRAEGRGLAAALPDVAVRRPRTTSIGGPEPWPGDGVVAGRADPSQHRLSITR